MTPIGDGNEGIEIIESEYDELCECLKEINKNSKIAKDEYEFAIELIEIDVNKRIDWLSEKINQNMLVNNGTVEEYLKSLESLEKLKNEI